MTKNERYDESYPIIKSIIRARRKLRRAETQYKAHENDFHFDMKYVTQCDVARKTLTRALDRLEKVWTAFV
jgi:hypothetical protein